MSTLGPRAFLALHTTGIRGAVAVAQDGPIEAQELAGEGQHAPALLPAVMRVLRTAGLGLADLSGVVVTTGPGSFTGIRVGLATAQGLARARGWMVLATDSLKAMAAACAKHAGLLGVVLDARRGEVFAALYETGADVPSVLLEPFCTTPQNAVSQMTALVSGASRIALVGSGVDLVRPLLVGHEQTVRTPEPADVARSLVQLARSNGCAEVEPQELVPTYLRKSDAEIKRHASTER